MKAKNYLPAGRRSERHRQRARLRRHGRRAHRQRNKVFFFASVERTRQRTEAGNALSNSGANGLAQPSDDGDARREFRRHRHRALRSAHRHCERHGPRAVRVCELSGPHVDDRSAIRRLQLHPGQPHQPDCEELPEQAGRADAAGIHEQLLRDQQLRHATTTSTTARSPGRRTARASTSTAGSDTRQLRGQRAGDAVRSMAASTRSSRDASGIRRFTATRWR